MSARLPCTYCDPTNPELDEQGRPYSCFVCGDTGYVAAPDAPAPVEVLADVLIKAGFLLGDVLVPEGCMQVYVGDFCLHLTVERMP